MYSIRVFQSPIRKTFLATPYISRSMPQIVPHGFPLYRFELRIYALRQSIFTIPFFTDFRIFDDHMLSVMSRC